MIALVRLVMHFSTDAGAMFNVRSTSANTGMAPWDRIGMMVPRSVIGSGDHFGARLQVQRAERDVYGGRPGRRGNGVGHSVRERELPFEFRNHLAIDAAEVLREQRLAQQFQLFEIERFPSAAWRNGHQLLAHRIESCASELRLCRRQNCPDHLVSVCLVFTGTRWLPACRAPYHRWSAGVGTNARAGWKTILPAALPSP